MLGFIMSKMQMLFFAVGIAVVLYLFLNFVSVMGLQKNADSLLIVNVKLISDQINSDLLCSFKQTNIPDKLVYGVGNTRFFYDLEFEKQEMIVGDEFTHPVSNLIVRIVEHAPENSTRPKNIVAAKSFTTQARFVLIDPIFLKDLTSINDSTYDVDSISLYPRAASTHDSISAPNGFVALKEIVNGKNTIYIIPCATGKEPNNCLMNILRVGCYKLSKKKEKSSETLIDSCFNINVPTSLNKSKNFNWKDCVALFPEIAISGVV